MLIDLSALLRGETKEIKVDHKIILDEAPEGIVYLAPATVKGRVTDSGGYIQLVSSAEVTYRGECARCLDTVEGVLCVDFQRTLVPEGTLSEKRLETVEDEDEYLVIKRGMLDMDEALREEIFLEFPFRLLCSENCAGLCPNCGKKLAEGEACHCKEAEIDPRWSKLKQLLSDD